MTVLALLVFGAALGVSGWAVVDAVKNSSGKIADALAGRPIRKDAR